MNTQEFQDAFQAAAPEGASVVMSTTSDAVTVRAFDPEGNEVGGVRVPTDTLERLSANDRGLKADIEKVFPKVKVSAKK